MKREPDICILYHKGNAESSAAHYYVKLTAKSYRTLIFNIIRSCNHNGITCEEIELSHDWKHQTVSARISELKRDGEIIANGKRQTTSGCMASIYFVKTKGQQMRLF